MSFSGANNTAWQGRIHTSASIALLAWLSYAWLTEGSAEALRYDFFDFFEPLSTIKMHVPCSSTILVVTQGP